MKINNMMGKKKTGRTFTTQSATVMVYDLQAQPLFSREQRGQSMRQACIMFMF